MFWIKNKVSAFLVVETHTPEIVMVKETQNYEVSLKKL